MRKQYFCAKLHSKTDCCLKMAYICCSSFEGNLDFNKTNFIILTTDGERYEC